MPMTMPQDDNRASMQPDSQQGTYVAESLFGTHISCGDHSNSCHMLGHLKGQAICIERHRLEQLSIAVQLLFVLQHSRELIVQHACASQTSCH